MIGVEVVLSNAPKERGILFSGEMVKAILAGRKTCTRRIVKVQPPAGFDRVTVMPISTETAWSNDETLQTFTKAVRSNSDPVKPKDVWLRCPHGEVGDRLWVREKWVETDTPEGTPIIAYCAGGTIPIGNDGKGKPDYLIHEWADKYGTPKTDSWRSPIHMPRWASRITLEITGVKVERLQDISEEDAKAEGITSRLVNDPMFKPDTVEFQSPLGWCPTAKVALEYIWDAMHGPDSWKANPWVWAISFKRIDDARAVA
jgi:hypothetical protein